MTTSKTEYTWDQTFMELFHRCLEKYQSGNSDFETYYSDNDLEFLGSIGYRKREFFDFVEDYADEKNPSPYTALLVAAARRDYFHHVMNGQASDQVVTPGDLPGKAENLGGFTWLPRILAKARGKLRGELDPNIMYCCGGDRNFLSTHDIAPADFLRVVWSIEDAKDPEAEIVKYVKSVSSAS